MADETKDLPPIDDDKTKALPPLEGEENEVQKVDDEPATRQPKEKAEDKEANRFGFELRKRDKAIKELNDKIAALQFNGGDDTEVNPDNAVNERLDRYEEKLAKLESEKTLEADIQGVIAKNPEYKKYEATIRKYANNDAYKNVDIDFIARGVVSKYGEAEKQADEKQSGGNTKRRTPNGKKDWANMSRDEFEREQARILNAS